MAAPKRKRRSTTGSCLTPCSVLRTRELLTDHNAGRLGFERGVRRGLFPLLLDEFPFGPEGGHRFLRLPDGHDAGPLGNQRLHDQTVEVGAKLAVVSGDKRRANPGGDGGTPGAVDVTRPRAGRRPASSWPRRCRDPDGAPLPSGRRSARRPRGADRPGRVCASRSSAVAHQSSSIMLSRGPRSDRARQRGLEEIRGGTKALAEIQRLPEPDEQIDLVARRQRRRLDGTNASRAATRSLASAFWRNRSRYERAITRAAASAHGGCRRATAAASMAPS